MPKDEEDDHADKLWTQLSKAAETGDGTLLTRHQVLLVMTLMRSPQINPGDMDDGL